MLVKAELKHRLNLRTVVLCQAVTAGGPPAAPAAVVASVPERVVDPNYVPSYLIDPIFAPLPDAPPAPGLAERLRSLWGGLARRRRPTSGAARPVMEGI